MIRRRSLAIYILLTLLTCGFYALYFWYCYTEDVNRMCEGDGEQSPNYMLVFILMILTFGIYGIYWFYKQANRLRNVAPRYGVTVHEGGDTFLIWFLVGCFLCVIGSFFSYNVLIANANKVAEGYNRQRGSGMPNEPIQSQPIQEFDSAQRAESKCFCNLCGAQMYIADQFCPQCGGKNTRWYAAGTEHVKTSPSIVDLSKMKDMPMNIKEAAVAFVLAAIIIVYGSISAILYPVNIGQTSYAIMAYILPAACLIVLGCLYYGNKHAYKSYESIPMIAFLGFLALECSRIPLAIAYRMRLSYVWQYEPLLGNLATVMILFAAVTACVLLCLEFMNIRNDTLLLIVGVIILVASGLAVISQIVVIIPDVRYAGIRNVFAVLGLMQMIAKALPLLLYMVKRDPTIMQNILGKIRK